MIEGCEEPILFSPDHVLVLLAHANASHEVQMGERNDNNAVVALDKGKLIAKSALGDDVAPATNCAR